MKSRLIPILTVIIAGAVVGLLAYHRQLAPRAAALGISGPVVVPFTTQQPARPTPAPDTAPAQVVSPAPTASQTAPAKTEDRSAPPPAAVQPVTPASKGGAEDPIARIALSFVGEDPEAEAYWIGAINDPNLSADERQNLIEDLNEDGLSDYRRPVPQDLPLIWNRLSLIEQLAPNAMDQVNLDAFAEAYKDLLNLEQVAMGGGSPVN